MASGQGSGSRLEKLFHLLQHGSTPTTQTEAARQIAEIAKACPQQVPSLQRKLAACLGHSAWVARVAAGEALGLITEHFRQPGVDDLRAAAGLAPERGHDEGATGEGVEGSVGEATFSFHTFDLQQVLEKGTPLLASGGQEFDSWQEELANATPEERLQRQRRNLKERLGMGAASDSFMNASDLVADEDLIAVAPAATESGTGRQAASQLVEEMAGGAMSARERNRLKRQAKLARTGSSSAKRSQSLNMEAAAAGAVSTTSSNAVANSEDSAAAEARAVEEDLQEWREICAGRWMFQRLADNMCTDVLHPNWQVRHGAAVALREVLRSRAGCAGVVVPAGIEGASVLLASDLLPGSQTPAAAKEAEQANTAWLQDCVIRLVCVLALDRFGDYVSDQVVAPVRETAAQALGSAMQALPVLSLVAVMSLLKQLKDRQEWQVRHGCILGWKYILAARQDLAARLLPEALPSLLQGLQDKDDDVRAAAAEALVPVADALLAAGQTTVAEVRDILWDILLDLQELSTSTASVMHLLAKLYSDPACQGNRDQLREFIPRLWPFFRHTLDPVRLAVLKCMQGVLDAEAAGAEWLEPVLPHACALVFQNLLLEDKEAVLQASERLWSSLLAVTPPHSLIKSLPSATVRGWAVLAATPPGAIFDVRHMIQVDTMAAAKDGEAPKSKRARLKAAQERLLYGGDRSNAPPAGDPAGSRARAAAGAALGALAAKWPRAGEDNPVFMAVGELLQGATATGRQISGMVMRAWVTAAGGASALEPLLHLAQQILAGAQASHPLPGSSDPYAELSPHYRQLRAELGALAGSRVAAVDESIRSVLGDAALGSASNEQLTQVAMLLRGHPRIPPAIRSRVDATLTTLAGLQQAEAAFHSAAQTALAGAVVAAAALPAKLNTLVQPLMGALRREADELLVTAAAEAMARLAGLCVTRKPSPNAKIVGNICNMACGDPAVTPNAAEADMSATPEVIEEAAASVSAEAIARKGAEAALRQLAAHFGGTLLEALPRLWECMAGALLTSPQADPQALVNNLQVLSVVGPAMDPSLRPRCSKLLPTIAACCEHANRAVRQSAARTLAVLAKADPVAVMPELLRLLVPLLSSPRDAARLGGAAAFASLVSTLRADVAPYTVLLLVPLLGRMADPLPAVRESATSGFALLVELLPLAQGLPAPEGLSPDQAKTWQQDSSLLDQLLDNKRTADFILPPAVSLSVTLRPYQQEGINWLAFLRRFGLHGVLADDMGLGKTLQAIAIAAAAAHDSMSAGGEGGKLGLPSLIACPPTLVGHWAAEIERFLGKSAVLRPLCYEGTAAARLPLRAEWETGGYNVIIMSYETCRADIAWLEPTRWLYVILDEGHIIKNSKTKVSQSVKRLFARHRLLLSGTPIQNDVLELWSIFDYLMPGFLGTERQFNAKFRRAVQVAKSSKKGSRETEAGLLAADSLHRTIMPFVLRRTKDQVLSDLPPKIIQDVYCSMSPLQLALYEQFAKSSAVEEVRQGISGPAGATAAPHVFQALQYLRKLCSHPALVIDPDVPEHDAALRAHCGCVDPRTEWEAAVRRDSLALAPKMEALRDILAQCQIGNWGGSGGEAEQRGNLGHRVLVFAQLRVLLDLVERDVLQPGAVSYLRLDGNVAANKRFEVAQRFNGDPTIEVLLLTTGVGGLGLNLTTADTVVFLEHDWNPQKDLQAMDRAHRLGQRRTVNVYRLLMRDTLEERIMGMQRFKLDIAEAVVNADNVSLRNMDTGQLLGLFGPAEDKGKAAPAPGAQEAAEAASAVGGKGLKAVLAGLEELWDESQYAEEFSLDGFMGKLQSKSAQP